MLETVRAYAGERFAALPDGESLRERHFGYFLSLAQCHGSIRRSTARTVASTSRAWTTRSGTSAPLCNGQPSGTRRARLLELSAGLVDYWMRRERFRRPSIGSCRRCRRSDAAGDPALRARALCKVCWPLWALGQRDELVPLLSEAEAIARTLTDPATRAEVLSNCAAVMSVSGRPEAAAPVADEALACANAAGDAWMIAIAAEARAMAAGSPDELRERVEQAASLLERVGNAHQLAGVFTYAAGAALGCGRDGDAAVYLQRALPLARELDQRSTWLRGNVGLAALLAGDSETARDAFREELVLGRDLVVPLARSQALTGLAAVAAVDDKLERAARLAGAGAAHRSRVPDDPVAARLDATFLEPARTRFGADAWDAAFGEGAALRFNEATIYALDEPQQQTGSPASDAPARTSQDR